MLEYTVLKSTERPGLKPEITYMLLYIASASVALSYSCITLYCRVPKLRPLHDRMVNGLPSPVSSPAAA